VQDARLFEISFVFGDECEVAQQVADARRVIEASPDVQTLLVRGAGLVVVALLRSKGSFQMQDPSDSGVVVVVYEDPSGQDELFVGIVETTFRSQRLGKVGVPACLFRTISQT